MHEATEDESSGTRDSNGETPTATYPQEFMQMLLECRKREFAYICSLAAAEKELVTVRCQVKDWRCNHLVTRNQIRSAIVDPTVNLEVKELRQKLFEKESLLRKAKEDLQARQFHSQSIMGQKLINKCKTLQEENSDLGKTMAESHLQPLAIQISNLKKRISFLMSELKQLRELNADMDSDHEALTVQLADMSLKYSIVKSERDLFERQVISLHSQIKESQLANATVNVPPTDSYRCDSDGGERGRRERLERRPRGEREKYSDRIREKERKVRDREREPRYGDTTRERRRRDKSRGGDERERGREMRGKEP